MLLGWKMRYVVALVLIQSYQSAVVSFHSVATKEDDSQTIIPVEKSTGSIDASTSVSEAVAIWPFDKHSNNTNNKSCASHRDCNECTTSSSLCHWCDGDQACHEIGSIHGCSWGGTCSNKNKNKTDSGGGTGGGSGGGGHTGSNNNSCAMIGSCDACYDTHTCHWCDNDQSCHSRGSIYGCTIGSTCKKSPDVPPKENSTCASHSTCSECALSSHLCHWCEYDNACHAKGSKYGCVTGVDCYSNDRCRRPDPEKFKGIVVTEMPWNKMIVLLVVAMLLCGCTSCCFYFAVGIKGAYDDLATISMAASRPPSMIGTSLMGTPEGETPQEVFHTSLETHPEEGGEGDEDKSTENVERDPEQDEEANQDPSSGATTGAAEVSANGEVGNNGDGSSDYVLMGEDPATREHAPLLPSQRQQQYYGNGGDASVVSEPTHMNRLYRTCAACYYLTIFVIVFLVGTCIYLYPKRPVYSVCNDSVAWTKIIENIAALKLDASFEILISLSNPNRFDVAVDKATGGFSFEGKRVGTFVIPPLTAASMAITDLMLIAHVTPDKYQALHLAEAYYKGKLILNADFQATLRIPALHDFTKTVSVDSIMVNTTDVIDRSLCACPSWDANNQTISMISDGSSLSLF